MASGSLDLTRPTADSAYGVAFVDWLACACGGTGERAARAARAAGEGMLGEVAFAASAGHVLDFDDTFSDGVAHVSATCAPAALVLAARLGRTQGEMLAAYAEGFEAMAAVAAASHPALYRGGWHPTAVCGPIGAAVVAARLLGLSEAERDNAVAAAVLRAGGTRAAFGSDGKAIQVGQAAAAGVQAALLAQAGVQVDPAAIFGELGFVGVLGAAWPAWPAGVVGGSGGAGDGAPAIERNWIKLHPSCLGTHSPIECAAAALDGGFGLDGGGVEVVVHPVARQAAHRDAVHDGLAAKFSIPYCVGFTLLRGRSPRVRDFAGVDEEVCAAARDVAVVVDASLPEFGAVLRSGGGELARVPYPRGGPENPASADDLALKVADLAGGRLDGVLADPEAPAALVLEALGI
ncbi:MAG TPA: MmgE/PrpD family protein [Solirubrobacteraceae bacterium]|nr:MmgE/PrpD family protein [Solirubrobacteraceae bacterium]